MKKFLFQSVIGILFGAFIAVLITNIVYLKGSHLLDGQLFLKNSLACIFCGYVNVDVGGYCRDHIRFGQGCAACERFAEG